MGLTDIVRSLALSAALAVPSACTTNNVSNYYGNEDGGTSGGRACGNSPLTGKYLWNLGDCEIGAERPADTNCRLYLTSDGEEHEDRYQGLTLYLDSFPKTRGQPLRLLKTFSCDDVCRASYQSPEEAVIKCREYQCALERNPELFVAEYEKEVCDEAGDNCMACYGVGLVDNLWIIQDSPWPGTEECRSMGLYDRSCFMGGGP